MAIQKMSSQEYNNILQNATNKIESISNEMNAIKTDIQKKLSIIRYEQDYLSYMNDKMSHSQEKDKTFVFLNTGKMDGLYEGYSNVVHAHYKNTPINVFNLKVANGTKSYFRDEVTVTINDIQDDYFKNILKADDIEDKEIFFEEYEFKSAVKTLEDGTTVEELNNHSTIVIERNKSTVIGTSKFNIIEIDPYLHKSFDINSIDIYTDDSENPAVTLNKINKVGKTRIVLDKKYEFNKVVMHITHNYNVKDMNTTIYPFGLKHIYFLEADFRSDSNIIVEYSSEEYINDIEDEIEVFTSIGSRISSLSEEGILVYLNYSNGMLQSLQEPSNEIKKPIARNVKTIYLRIPLNNEAIIGYNFSITTR